MKWLISFLLAFGVCIVPFKATQAQEEGEISESAVVVAEDEYDFTMQMKVPQVFNNTKSLGYRKVVSQTIKGKMYVQWYDDGSYGLAFANLKNRNFRVSNANVTYTGEEDRYVIPTRFNWIGNNKTEKFTTPCLCFYLELEPSYATGYNGEDNSFYVLLAGFGSSAYKKNISSRVATRFRGKVAGTQGCGCTLYQHKSPTREATIDGPSITKTSDVVATYGSWNATWKKRNFKN